MSNSGSAIEVSYLITAPWSNGWEGGGGKGGPTLFLLWGVEGGELQSLAWELWCGGGTPGGCVLSIADPFNVSPVMCVFSWCDTVPTSFNKTEIEIIINVERCEKTNVMLMCVFYSG